MKKQTIFCCSALILAVMLTAGMAWAADQKPNILVVWGDDVGQSNIRLRWGWWAIGSQISIASPRKG
jgi:hypothetical protein